MELQPDWNAFLSLLRRHRVRFLLIGGHAVAAHGHVRFTKDLDVYVEASETNARRLGLALAEFGYPETARAWKWMTEPDRMIKLGREPLRIDILTSIAGVSFERAWKGRTKVKLRAGTIPLIGIRELLINKRSTGRPEDQRDVVLLEEITRAASRSRRTRRQRAAASSRKPGTRRR